MTTARWRPRPAPFPVQRCARCGKQWFTTRKAAKRYAATNNLAGLRPYRCGELWHLGTLPEKVVHGDATRDDLVLPRKPPPWRRPPNC